MNKWYRRCAIFIETFGQMLSLNKWYRRCMIFIGALMHLVLTVLYNHPIYFHLKHYRIILIL